MRLFFNLKMMPDIIFKSSNYHIFKLKYTLQPINNTLEKGGYA